MIGAASLEKKLKKFADKEIAAVCRKATRASAIVIRTEARATVPERTGTLRRAIKIKASSKKGAIVADVNIKRDDAYYFSFVELGTSKQVAKEFLAKAVKAKKGEAIEVATQRLSTEIGAWK